VTRPILFLSDYGLDDEFVGVCHAVIARIAPEVPIIDLAHGIPPQDVLAGGLTLAAATPHAPPDAVYLAVVDPHVGTERRPVALEAGSALLVGPDNGLLPPACDALGGPRDAVAIEAEKVARAPVSPTFHGRDVFAPAAAHLAMGTGLHDLGVPIDPSSLTRLSRLEPDVGPGRVAARVIGVDRFGNVRLAAREADLERAGLTGRLTVSAGGLAAPAHRVRTFAEVPDAAYGLLVDSAGWAAVVRNLGNAAHDLGARRGGWVELRADGVG
jgi:S-adenosyl-L-methionine hydrolase (adenosine-forming)